MDTPEARVDDAVRDLALTLRRLPDRVWLALLEARDDPHFDAALRDLWQQLLVTGAALRDADAATLERLDLPARVGDEGGSDDVR